MGGLVGLATGGLWLGVFRDASVYRLHWWVAVVFGCSSALGLPRMKHWEDWGRPLGATLRHGLSGLNAKHPNFPLGTYIANSLGNSCLPSQQAQGLRKGALQEACWRWAS